MLLIEKNGNKLLLKKIVKTGLCFLVFTALVLSNGYVYSQEVKKKASKQSGLESFSKSEFETSLAEFTELSNQFSRDPVYKYYIGACLVSLERQPLKAEEFLQSAIESSGVLATVPADSWFYLGRARQQSGKFADAITAYNTFTEVAGKKNAKSFGVPDFIKQSVEKEGRIEEIITPVPTENVTPQKVFTPIDVQKIDVPKEPDKQVFEKIPVDEDNRLNTALDLQYKADSVTRVADGLRKEINTSVWDKRIILQKRINSLDSLASVFQKQADNQYFETRVENALSEKAKEPNDFEIVGVALKKDTILVPEGIYSVFETKKQNLNETKVIPVNEPLPAGLIYLIQLGVFRNAVNTDNFKGLGSITGIKAEGSDITYYYAGFFRRLADAGRALLEVNNAGFKDAFTVAMADNKPVSIDRAKILENEWGNKPLYNVITEPINNAQSATKDTITASLLFRVEVLRSQQALKADVIDNIQTLAGSRGFDIIDEKGFHIYLIGKFINFESASEYNDLLIRNGYKKAKVVAYIGKIEIPVEMAMKLFEK